MGGASGAGLNPLTGSSHPRARGRSKGPGPAPSASPLARTADVTGPATNGDARPRPLRRPRRTRSGRRRRAMSRRVGAEMASDYSAEKNKAKFRQMSRRNFCDEIPQNLVFNWKRRHRRALVSSRMDVNRFSAVSAVFRTEKFRRNFCGFFVIFFSCSVKQVNGAGDEWKRRPIASQMRTTLSVYRFHVKVHLQAKKEVEKFRPVSHYAPPPPSSRWLLNNRWRSMCMLSRSRSLDICIYTTPAAHQNVYPSLSRRQLSCDVISDVIFSGEISLFSFS